MSDPVPTTAALPKPSPEELKAFHDAVENGGSGAVHAFLDRHGSAFVEEEDAVGRPPLMIAALHNCRNIAVLLLDRGADVRRRGYFSRTALIQASIGNNMDMARLLLERGADIDARDSDDKTALMWAEKYNRTELIAFLKEWSETKNQREAEQKRQQEEKDFALAAAARLENRMNRLKQLRPARPALKKPGL